MEIEINGMSMEGWQMVSERFPATDDSKINKSLHKTFWKFLNKGDCYKSKQRY